MISRGDRGVLQGRVRILWLGADQRRGAIVLEVFGKVSIGVGELRNFELVSVGEEYRWLNNGVDL